VAARILWLPDCHLPRDLRGSEGPLRVAPTTLDRAGYSTGKSGRAASLLRKVSGLVEGVRLGSADVDPLQHTNHLGR
jgi:hypothetical protein